MHLAFLFNSIVKKYPNSPAIKTLESTITFAELDASSNQLMSQLQLMGILPHNRVGLLFNNRFLYINAIIALVKLSAAYVPFELKESVENIENLCNLASIDFLLHDNTEGLNCVFDRYTPALITEDLISITAANHKSVSTAIFNPLENPVLYIMFTSGTTGKPKGVVVKHTGVSRFIEHPTHVSVSQSDTFIQTSSVAFDASTYEIWISLLNGASLVLVANDFDFLTLGNVIKKYGINIVWLTTKLFETLSITNCSMFRDLKYLIFGGEACSYKHIMAAFHLLPNTKLINGYGPTENTVFTTMHQITDADTRRNFIPIGLPVSESICYVLNERLEPLSDGSEGMLYVGGNGLADCYLDEVTTAEKFIIHSTIGVRLYKTGDVVKFDSSFGFQYIGRVDRQVKVRGFRVELDLIEAAASTIEHLMHAHAVYNSQQFKHSLVLYYTTKDKKELDNQVILTHLKQQLPWYSIPSTFIHLKDTKYNISNKIDIKQLVNDTAAALVANEHYPNKEENDVLKKIWCYVLDAAVVNDYDNFFNDCGGDSITSLILMNEVNKEFELNLPVGYLITNPRFIDFKNNLYNKNKDLKGIIQLKEGKGEIPLFLIPPAGKGPEMYISLVEKLTSSLNIYSFTQIEKFDANNNIDISKIDNQFVKRFSNIYASHISKKNTYKKIVLAGYSIGGNIAVEIKHILDKLGIETVAIHLFDSYKLGNTAINLGHELHFRPPHIKKLILTLKKAIITKRKTHFTSFVKMLYMREINSKRIKNTQVILYRCNDVYGTVKNTTSLGWDKKVTDLHIININTNHASMFNEVNTDLLANKMDEKLAIFAPTSAKVCSPNSVLKEVLDDYLSRGWFRIKQQLFTDNRTVFNNEILSVTWIRYNLSLYQERKSHKKIFYLNKSLTIDILDFNYHVYLDRKNELEQLYSKYLTSIDFDAKKTVYNVLYTTKKTTIDIFQSKLITAYDADTLVGVGIFDIGINSGAQILNYHDPAYAKKSLSRYTVLKTIEYLQNLGYQYFYPGYIFNEHPKMDYKFSLGSEIIEYLDYEKKTWEEYSKIPIKRL